MKRQSVAFFLGDVGFLSDPKFRKLARRLTDPDDFNSAVGAYWIALAAARRNGLPDVDVEGETDSRFVGDLRAVGLLTEGGFPETAFVGWAPSRAPRPSELGRRVASKVSDDVESVESDKNVISSTPLPSIQLNSENEQDARADFDSLDVYHELTGFRPWGAWSGDEIKAAMTEYGDVSVEAALRSEYHADAQRDTLWKRTKTRLAKDADRHREEAKAKPRPIRPKRDSEAEYRESQRIQAGLIDGSIKPEEIPA